VQCSEEAKALRGQSVRMMTDSIARKSPPACRDDGQNQLERAMQPALYSVSGLHHRSLVVNSTVDSRGESAMPASARGVHRRLPEADPNRPPIADPFASDPFLVAPVIASLEEVLLARELRQQIRGRYLDRPSQPCSLWCVGID